MISIRVVFPLIFALQIFVAVGLTGTIAYVSHMRDAQETATEILDLIGSTMDDQLYKFLSIPIDLTQIYADGLKSQSALRFDDLLNPTLVRKVVEGVWAQSQMSRWVNLTIANPAGQNLRYDRKEYGKQMVKVSDRGQGGSIYWYLSEQYGRGGEPLEVQRVAYDPRTQPYYKAAVDQGRLVISPIHFSPLLKGAAPVVTVAEPVYDAQQKLRVVVSSDIYLEGISRYLSDLSLPRSSVAFIFDPDGQLIASSRPDAEKIQVSANEGHLPSILESGDAAIRSTAGYLKQRFGSFDVPEAGSFQFISANQRNYVYAAHLFTEFGLNWKLAVVIAENGLIENLVDGIYSTAWVSLALLVLAIVIGLWTAAWMIRPIITLGTVASALEKDELDAQHLDIRRLETDARRRNEFGELARIFLRMVQEIRVRNDLLEAQLEQLRVNIDHGDTQSQIKQITESEFFADLKNKARKIRIERKLAVEHSAPSFIEHEP